MVLFLSKIVYFGEHDSKKPFGTVGKWGPISKKLGFLIFLAKGKNQTPRHVEIPKWPTRVCPKGSRLFARPFWSDHFGTTYFIAGCFWHRSFRRQFGALRQFSYLQLGLGSGLGFGLGLVKKHRILAPKRSAPKWSRWKVVDPCPNGHGLSFLLNVYKWLQRLFINALFSPQTFLLTISKWTVDQ